MIKKMLMPLLPVMLLAACGGPKEKPAKEFATLDSKAATAVSVERGAYLVNSIGCADCHTPKIMTDHGPALDPTRSLSGHPANEGYPSLFDEPVDDVIMFNMHGTAQRGPWGISFAANLTPDDTGIGNWTEEQFLRAIKKGKYKGLEGSRNLLPLMPWEFYRNLTDNDLKSMFAYLKTLEPIENVVPPPIPPKGA